MCIRDWCDRERKRQVTKLRTLRYLYPLNRMKSGILDRDLCKQALARLKSQAEPHRPFKRKVQPGLLGDTFCDLLPIVVGIKKYRCPDQQRGEAHSQPDS